MDTCICNPSLSHRTSSYYSSELVRMRSLKNTIDILLLKTGGSFRKC